MFGKEELTFLKKNSMLTRINLELKLLTIATTTKQQYIYNYRESFSNMNYSLMISQIPLCPVHEITLNTSEDGSNWLFRLKNNF